VLLLRTLRTSKPAARAKAKLFFVVHRLFTVGAGNGRITSKKKIRIRSGSLFVAAEVTRRTLQIGEGFRLLTSAATKQGFSKRC
jgi:hypothetical protein